MCAHAHVWAHLLEDRLKPQHVGLPLVALQLRRLCPPPQLARRGPRVAQLGPGGGWR